ncbi:MAG: hypothetical protein AAF618_04145 [Pseudomonadota bacterium]
MKLHRRLAGALLVSAGLAIGATSASGQEFYEGKTITCVVPFPPGGGTDSFFRVIVPHLARLIPGQPDIVIQNMDGSGGLRANNFVATEAQADGMTLLCTPWLAMAQLTEQQGARFDYSEMELIGGQFSVDGALINREILPDEDPRNILEATETVVIGGIAPAGQLDLRMRLTMDILGAEYRYVPGYRGQAVQLPAFLSGEIHMIATNYGNYVRINKEAYVDNGPGTMFVHFPSFDADGNPIPSEQMQEIGVLRVDELYAELNDGAMPEGQLWEAFALLQTLSNNMGLSAWLPPGSPQEAVDALRAGWYAMPEDEEFRQAHREAFNREVSFLPLEQALFTQATIGTVSDEMRDFFKAYIEEGQQ